jgi:nitrite reductase/ring-hydroxylating ferredoxin subunit
MTNTVSGRQEQWRAEFPYHWDEDDTITRRELLRFTVYTSGALFAAAVGLAAFNRFYRSRAAGVKPLVRLSELVPGQAFHFNYPDPDDESILIHLPEGRLVAYSQRCTHLSCSVSYQPERERLFCPCHDGAFDPRTGEPIAGPPRRRLPRITLEETNGIIYAKELLP